MTIDRYGHMFESLQQDMADRLDGIYRSSASAKAGGAES